MIQRDGSTLQGQRILSDGEALVRAIVESEMEHVSAKESGSFAWSTTFATGGTNRDVLTIKNDNASKDLIIERVFLGADAAAVFTVGHVTSGTPAGSTVTPTCLNRGAIRTAEATAFGDAEVTGTVVTANIWTAAVLADAPPFVINTLGSLLLAKDDVFGIACSTSVTINITVMGYFADPSEL